MSYIPYSRKYPHVQISEVYESEGKKFQNIRCTHCGEVEKTRHNAFCANDDFEKRLAFDDTHQRCKKSVGTEEEDENFTEAETILDYISMGCILALVGMILYCIWKAST